MDVQGWVTAAIPMITAVGLKIIGAVVLAKKRSA